ncbi:outer membrane protein assembly factor BamD [soil metagenome]|nr:outer membrane protein assembly factor BamD [Gemmatimonadota bacterium]
MITLRHIPRAFFLLTLLALSACGGRQQRPDQLAPDVLYQRGTEAFEAGRHARAIEFLQPFVLQHIGDPRMPDALYTLGSAFMQRREFISAASEFQRLAADFPSHPQAVPARLGTCEAYMQLSPQPQLDQEYTHAALAHCEALAISFPGAPEGEQASAHIAELRGRLAQKAYETGMFYFRRRAYDASMVYFQEAVNSFPDTTVAPAALLRLYEAYTQVGYVEDAQEARERLLREYPQSAEARGLRA